MDICEALFKYFNEDVDIINIVKMNIYPLYIPQGITLPAITYQPTSAKYDSTLTGDSSYVRQNIQINCHETSFKKARILSNLIRSKLINYHGKMYGVEIEAVFVKTDMVLTNNSIENFSTERYMSVLEIEIHFNEKK